MNTKTTATICTLALFLVSIAAPDVRAQASFPTQRVTLVVPLAPGGAMDIVARAIAPLLEQQWRQPVIVENRPGGALMLGAGFVARSAPDGHTLLILGNGLKPSRLFVKDMDPAISDMRPVVQLVRGSYLVATNADIPAKTLAEFIAYAKARPGKLNFGTIPNTTFDLDYAHFALKAGLEMTGIPYQGTPAAATALGRNEIQFFFGVPATIAPLVSSGRITVLAAAPAQRMELHPTVPTVRELGIDFDGGYDFGLFAPARTPDSAVALIAADAATAVKTPAVAARFRAFGFEVTGLPGQTWGEEMDRSLRIYTELANKLGIKPQ